MKRRFDAFLQELRVIKQFNIEDMLHYQNYNHHVVNSFAVIFNEKSHQFNATKYFFTIFRHLKTSQHTRILNNMTALISRRSVCFSFI